MKDEKTEVLVCLDKDQMLKDLRGLLQINSTSHDAGLVTEEAPLGENIKKAIDYVLDLGENFGFRTKDLDGYCGWVEMGPEEADEMVGILVHVDTVPVGDDWDYEPFDLTIEDGKMYGRGTNDDKGPAIASLYAMKVVDDSDVDLDRRIRLIVGGDEEVGDWQCMERYKKTEELPTYAFSPDGDYPLIFAEKGILHLDFKGTGLEGDDIVIEAGSAPNVVPDKAYARVGDKEYRTEGVASHAMEPEKGDNALLKLGKLLKEEGVNHPFLDLLEIANNEGLGIEISDEVSGPLTYNPAIGKVEGSEAVLTSDIRYPVTLKVEDFIDNIKNAVEPLGFEVEVKSQVEPLYVDVDSELVTKLLDTYNRVMGVNDEAIAIGGGTYARAFDNAVAFGILFPGEENMCHKTNEYWPLQDLYSNTSIIAEAIKALGVKE